MYLNLDDIFDSETPRSISGIAAVRYGTVRYGTARYGTSLKVDMDDLLHSSLFLFHFSSLLFFSSIYL